ncbi:MAG: class I SAM-dependent methyltransferase [Actinomycetota bacterium]
MGTDAARYGEVFAPVYDEWYSDLDDADFISYITRCRSEHDHLRVLELGVGTGRLVESFIAARGHSHDEFVGIDSSTSMLERLRTRHGSLPVTAVHGDMASSLPQGPFDVVFCGYNTIFNLSDDDALVSCLQEVARVLRHDGDFFVDMATPLNGDDMTSRGPVAVSRGGHNMLSTSTHDVRTQTVTGEFVHFASPRDVRRYPWSIRYWTPAQFDALARQSGLLCVERVADGTGAPWAPHISRHISRFRVAT